MTTATIEHSAALFDADRHLIGGRYSTTARIGKGRLGEIFEAVDENFEKLGVEQLVAIQILPESTVANNKLFNRLSRGYTTLKAGAHPNIVEYLQFGRDGKFGFIAMELLDGVSLRELLDEVETLTPDEAKPVIRGVGNALEHLHAKDIVHGNVTSRNVFVGDDLEARLLDVVPLAADETMLRRAAMSEPSGLCTVQEDVFGLACLAYELLSGKHPFNYCLPDEAKSAGLKADRIDSLSDDEWNALSRAMSFEREQRMSSVKDFMRDFGIRGTESLRPAIDHPVDEAAPIVPADVPVQPVETVAPAVDVDPMSWNEDDLTGSRPRRNRGHRLRTVILGTLLAGLVAWTYFGQPEEHFANAIGYVDETMDLGLIASEDPVAAVGIADPALPALADQMAPVELPADEAAVDTADEVLDGTDGDSTQTEPDIVFVDPVVSVSEGDAAARIALQHNTDSTMHLTWWTSEHTAMADVDFVAGKYRVMTGASLGEDNTLHVPLINDSAPEPMKSFFVHLELRNTEDGLIERFDTVRVDIIDDDLP